MRPQPVQTMQEIKHGLPSVAPSPRRSHWRGNYRLCVAAPHWIDLYGHMNMACYAMVLDLLGHDILEDCGFGESWTRKTRLGLFTVQANIRYHREIRQGDPLRITMVLNRHDDKRIFAELRMHQDEKGFLAATMDQVSICASLDTRRAMPFPEADRARIASLL